MTMAAMVAVIYRLPRFVGCLRGELTVVVGISGLVRMVEFKVLGAALMKLVRIGNSRH